MVSNQGSFFLGTVFIPKDGSVSLHDIEAAIITLKREAWAIMMNGLGAPLPSWVTLDDFVEYCFKEYLSKNFGYNVRDHHKNVEPYRTIYQTLMSHSQCLHSLLSFYGHRIYGDAPVEVSIVNCTLVLVYQRA